MRPDAFHGFVDLVHRRAYKPDAAFAPRFGLLSGTTDKDSYVTPARRPVCAQAEQ